MYENSGKVSFSMCSIFPGEKDSGIFSGIVRNLKLDEYKKKDGAPQARLTFGLACNNISARIESRLGVKPVANKKNPIVTYINCTAFGDRAQKMNNLIADGDVVFVSGYIDTYPSKHAGEHRINVVVDEVAVKQYSKHRDLGYFEESQTIIQEIDDAYPDF